MIEKIKRFFRELIPTVYNLPEVIYVRWFNTIWYIKK